MSNYNLSPKLIKKLNDIYHIDYIQFLKYLEYYNESDFSTKYVYAKIIKKENKNIVDLAEILNFNVDDLNLIFTKECSLKFEIYKIMTLKNKLYKLESQEYLRINRYNQLNPNTQKRQLRDLKIDITFSIIAYTGLMGYLKKDKCYTYLHVNRLDNHYKNIYDFLLTCFQEINMECSEEHINSLNKEDFNNLMSIFDMMAI